MKNQLGKIHVYTGDGKGKTTAVLGLALRALGAGFRVCLIQFLKGQFCSELKSLKNFKNIQVYCFGQKSFIKKAGRPADKSAAQKAMVWAEKIFRAKKFNLVILDEIFLAVFFKLLSVNRLIRLIENKPKNVELVLTGRRAPKEIIKLADYVTEMKEIKHPYRKGLMARRGIED